MLERLIFGEKRKQHASPGRHRSATRSYGSMADVSSSGAGGRSKHPINVHDWAAWRMQLNEQLGAGITDRGDVKQMREFLHSNQFYRQHSRDPSNGRYNGVKLLFSIPHAKLQHEFADGAREVNKNTPQDPVEITNMHDRNSARLNNNDCITTSMHSMSLTSSIITDGTISQIVPNNQLGSMNGNSLAHDPIFSVNPIQPRRLARAPFLASDRVHSTLQKAVKDGNVLEKIKAFEMQAAAAQAESTTAKSGVANVLSNRIQSVTSAIQSVANRTLSPALVHPMQHPISPIPLQYPIPSKHTHYDMQHQQQQQQHIQNMRAHRSRFGHSDHRRRDNSYGPNYGRESRKGAHVLEPAHGDIILKRRTPSQKTANDEDHSYTAMSSMALTAPQNYSHSHHHRHHHGHHRTSASRSRHRHDKSYDRHTLSYHETVPKKSQQAKKENKPSKSTTKTSIHRRWLKGRKDTSCEDIPEKVKQEQTASKSHKNKKNKNKNNESDKVETQTRTVSPNADQAKKPSSSDEKSTQSTQNKKTTDQTKGESTLPQVPSPINEENESDKEEKEKKETNKKTESDTMEIKFVERRSDKQKHYQKLSSTDGEILSKIDDETRFSRPTDDHAHRSELNDDDDECKSEGDVFIDESSITNSNLQQHTLNSNRNRTTPNANSKSPSPRRWQWSKESGGLIEKSNQKKKQSSTANSIPTPKNTTSKTPEDDETIVYETPLSEQSQPIVSTNKQFNTKTQLSNVNSPTENNSERNNNHINNAQIKQNNDHDKQDTDEYSQNGPQTNYEEKIINVTSTA